MASDCSFDIVSQYDEQELANTLDQARREIQNRYDLKDTKTAIAHSKDALTLETDSEMSLKSVRDIIETKAVKRGLSLKIFDYGKEETAGGGRVRQSVNLKQGISQEFAKDMNKQIRDNFPKVKPQIQGDAVRVTSKSRDELQAVMTFLKGKDFPVALQFTNYR